jgi:hypothetical protein
MKVPFSQVPVGKVFKCNGNLCYKKSTRTAFLVFSSDDSPFGAPVADGSWFYFGQNDICVI